MISFSGLSLISDQRAYALVCPATADGGETEIFGFAPKLADILLSWKGWWKDEPAAELEDKIEAAQRADKTFNPALQRQRIRTQDEINACVQALLDPHIEVWGYRLVEAQHRVVRASIWTLELGELMPYYKAKGGALRSCGDKLIRLPDGRTISNDGYYTAEEKIRTHLEMARWSCSEKQALLAMYIEQEEIEGALAEQIRRQIDEDCD